MAYFVYVVALDPAVARLPRFRARNPGLALDAECVYVGQSAHEPDCRYRQHKECHGPVIRFACICERPLGDFSRNLSNRYVRTYGRHLRRDLYERLNPFRTRAAAERAEKQLAPRPGRPRLRRLVGIAKATCLVGADQAIGAKPFW